MTFFVFLFTCMLEIQCGHDKSQIPVDSCGKPCDPQQGPHLGEVRHSCSPRDVLAVLREMQAVKT